MLKDAKGNRLYRTVKVRVVFPDNIFPEKIFSQHAGPHQGFGPDNIDTILESIADDLDTKFPWWEFTYIELAPEGRTARFTFKFAGYRATKTDKPDFDLKSCTTVPPNDERSDPLLPAPESDGENICRECAGPDDKDHS